MGANPQLFLNCVNYTVAWLLLKSLAVCLNLIIIVRLSELHALRNGWSTLSDNPSNLIVDAIVSIPDIELISTVISVWDDSHSHDQTYFLQCPPDSGPE